jgi:Fe-S oxidoreductase
MVIEKQVCCGLPALEAGYENESRKLMRRNFEIMKEEGIKSIITSSPCCYKMFLQNYPQMLPDWNIEIKNLWQIILDKLQEKPRMIKIPANEKAGYQDSCYLGRYCGIYQEPRSILKMIGYDVQEMVDSKENAFCCGSCGGLKRINSELAEKIARERVLQAKRAGIKKIIVNSILDYELMKKSSEGTGVEIIEFSEALGHALGIKKREISGKKTSETMDNPFISEVEKDDI